MYKQIKDKQYNKMKVSRAQKNSMDGTQQVRIKKRKLNKSMVPRTISKTQ